MHASTPSLCAADAVAAQQQLHHQQQQQALNNVLNNQGALNAGALNGLGAGFNGLPAGAGLAPNALSAGPLGNSTALSAAGGIPAALTTGSAPRNSIDGLLHLFDNNHSLNPRPGNGLPGHLFGNNGAGQIYPRDGGPAASSSATQELLLGSNNAVAAAVRNSGYAWSVDHFGGDNGRNGGEVKAERPPSPGVHAVENGSDDAHRIVEAVQRLAPPDGADWQVCVCAAQALLYSF